MGDFSLEIFLKQLPFFSRISKPHLTRLVEGAIRHSFTAGQMIFMEGEESKGLWIIERGRVKAFKLSPDGREYILSFFSSGDIFNDLAALDDTPCIANTTAVTEVVAWVIPTALFSSVLQEDHELCLSVLKSLAGRTRELVNRMEDLALRPVTARLARFLLEQVEDPSLAHPAVTRALIANYLATTPESISRSLRALESVGAIRFDRHRIVIVSLEVLHQQAQL